MTQDIRAMLRSEAWAGLQSRNEQVVFLHNFAETECGESLFNQVLGYVFEIQESHMRKIHSKTKTKARAPHRPLALNSEEENVVMEFIEAGHSKGEFVTQRGMLSFVEGNFGNRLTYGWVMTFLIRHVDRVCRAVVSHKKSLVLRFLERF
jgi:hypothetical protein